MEDIKQFIFTTDDYNNEIAILNPEWEKQQRQKRYDIYLQKSKIPNFYHNINWDNYQGDKSCDSYRKIKHYADNIEDPKFNHVNLFLYGIHGSQKSAIACNVAKTALSKGLKSRFILAGSLIDKLMKCQGFNAPVDIVQEIQDIKKNDLLIIDDIFDTQKGLYWKGDGNSLILTEWDTFLRDIISEGVKIVCTCNYSPSIIKQHFGESIHQLIDRNFVVFELKDIITEKRKLDVMSAFDGV